ASRLGNASGAKDPGFWHASEDCEVKVIGDEPANTDYDPGPSVEARTARRRCITSEVSSLDISIEAAAHRGLCGEANRKAECRKSAPRLMSGDGKRSAGHRPQATAPILDGLPDV